MRFSPQWIRKILGFLKIFNLITLPIIIGLFLVCIILDIPLKYLLGFLALYGVTMSISLIFDTKKHVQKNIIQEYEYAFLIGINIVLYVILSLLINRYQLDSYRWSIYLVSFFVINWVYFEFHKKYISRFFMKFIATSIWRWIIHTTFLLLASGIVFMIWNSITGNNVPGREKTSSEVTGILSTIDTTVSWETITIVKDETVPWETMWRYLGIGNSGEDVLTIQKYLLDKGYYTGELSGNYDEQTAMAINTYIGETTGEVFTRPEFGAMKLAFLRKLSAESNPTSPIISSFTWAEATGTLVTSGSGWVEINSIESVDGWATATIQDGKIVVQVVSQWETASNSDNWEVQAVLKNVRWAGWLQGVVISAAKPFPAAGTYKKYQSITFSADGASGIFFTADGTDPTCQWKWLTKIIRQNDTITIKAISCFWWNKIRWPISSHTFMLNK